jgi:hypothetical protein
LNRFSDTENKLLESGRISNVLLPLMLINMVKLLSHPVLSDFGMIEKRDVLLINICRNLVLYP